ncbi:MAG TPA: serine/threonine-protein kinase, partial [Vicinamibacterales bacterium]|nr:serine/threonine-protein kinase [Vicinamibacterales bacterium]
DLEKRIARVGKMSAPAASHIIRQVASALAATHAKGIVHRDLKPANVFLLSVEGETDFVKVVDFGISKVRAAGTKLTAALAVMGTPNYMAPEQAAGRVDEIDHRTDQWALACIAYELLAGRPPFIGEDVASLLYQVIHQAPSPIASMNPGLPAAIEDVLRRALSKTQVGRYGTMTEFSRAFEGAATGKAPPATSPALSAQAPAVVAHAPTITAGGGGAVPPVTTFSSSAGESMAGGTMRVRPARRWLLAGGGIALAAAAGAGGFAFISGRSVAPVPAAAIAPAAPAPGAARNVAAPREAPAPTAAVVPGAVDAGAANVAAAPEATTAKKSRRPKPAWPVADRPRAQPTAAPVAAEPPPQPPPAAEPPREPPPPPPAAAAPSPAWPPPAWPPPSSNPPPGQQKRPGLFKRIFR